MFTCVIALKGYTYFNSLTCWTRMVLKPYDIVFVDVVVVVVGVVVTVFEKCLRFS